MPRLSRREFVRLSTAGAVASPLLVDPAVLGAAAPTAQEVVDRIRKTLGVPWKAETVDSFKAGDPSTVVTGVVTTSLATIDVMRRAVKAGANMVITSGPTFYSRADSPTPPAGRGRGAAAATPPADPVFAAKNAFIKANNLVVWRFNDHWRLRTPDPFTQGIIDALGWGKHPTGSAPGHVKVPAITLEALVAAAKATLGARGGMRIIGNPGARLQTIAVLPGTVPIQAALTHLPQVDAIIAGEIREWESSEYARDTITAGRDKALILIGRTLSEDPGMKVCAQWLETVVPEAPVRWLAAGDPYWRPAA
jgi:putative NIF3 family GTP cyclohydrolase 1 type 2